MNMGKIILFKDKIIDNSIGELNIIDEILMI